MLTLVTLPIELLYEIQLLAASHTLPRTCRALYSIFTASPPSYRAQYLLACTRVPHPQKDISLTKILRYPICTKIVFEAYLRLQKTVPDPGRENRSAPELPRRLFRALVRTSALTTAWSDGDPPLPFLRYLYTRPDMLPPNPNSHDGYALTKAVQVGFVPLVRFLLNHGATPVWKSNLAVIIAIHRGDLGLVRMLVERTDTKKSTQNIKVGGKRRRLEDRVEVTPAMLKAAVKCKAQDIVEYLTTEKGCIPDMQTLLMMR